MGLLSLGTPLPWNKASKYADHVRKHGIIQFLNVWKKEKMHRRTNLLWGDEIEYTVVHMNKDHKARISIHAAEILHELQEDEKNKKNYNASWKPEYAKYMIEGTPNQPYGSTIYDLLTVENNMKNRRKLIREKLNKDEIVTSLTTFPTLGAKDFIYPPYLPTADSGSSQSLYIPEEAITSHARFPTLTANIRKRRGSKVAINLPIYKDKNTPSPFLEPLSYLSKKLFTKILNSNSNGQLSLPEIVSDAKKDHVYLDCMCFGMGCSCLQITFQACCIEEARKLYDLLAPMSPIMLAITAGAPAYKGYLTDTDCRWDVISGSVDDRNEEERGLKPLKNSRFVINKSRYDSIDSYLSPGPQYFRDHQFKNHYLNCCFSSISHYKSKYNDIPLVYDKDIYKKLIDNRVDDLLAKHIAHLFIRDPIVIFNELLNQNDNKSMDHFENIQSTNWQTLRFKPPPSNSDIGWRVEFRSMEVQLTDFANAAFSIFIVLLTRTILAFNLNFYIPISKVDENMKTAQIRDAARTKKFWFRKNIIPTDSVFEGKHSDDNNNNQNENGDRNRNRNEGENEDEDEDAFELMTINEIFNGNPKNNFMGLIPLIRSYLSSIRLDTNTFSSLERYLYFISKRASGELVTDAVWIRNFIRSHKDYKQDSIVNSTIVYDLCKILEGVNQGRESALMRIYKTVGDGIFGSKSIFSSDHINIINSTPFCNYYNKTDRLPCLQSHCFTRFSKDHCEFLQYKRFVHLNLNRQRRKYSYHRCFINDLNNVYPGTLDECYVSHSNFSKNITLSELNHIKNQDISISYPLPWLKQDQIY
ncbi:GCS-domain-containing protein [Anaeromyces robustus]|uniref:Glutamate--cysteine ligase n=1 Tax=Anaeromyces robustus TaxID=1754192 RepID=A0A1Y1WXD1_9FUNG|nr:GCS-domain-containing protein [Anaeromyces robustus]|eukprot:ORX77978.1 GCS-domain-containing protein [Anaeromyces robustus]